MSAGYGLAVLLALGFSAAVWNRRAREDQRLLIVYIAALAGGLFGAKLLYYLAEGTPATSWRELLVGKSVLGSLLGGYVAVELAKKLIGYSKVTGDLFATVLPIAIAIGPLGLHLSGLLPRTRLRLRVAFDARC